MVGLGGVDVDTSEYVSNTFRIRLNTFQEHAQKGVDSWGLPPTIPNSKLPREPQDAVHYLLIRRMQKWHPFAFKLYLSHMSMYVSTH